MRLLPALAGARASRPAVAFPDGALSYAELAARGGGAARAPARGGARRAVGDARTPRPRSGCSPALRAGLRRRPAEPEVGAGELAHILGETAPERAARATRGRRARGPARRSRRAPAPAARARRAAPRRAGGRPDRLHERHDRAAQGGRARRRRDRREPRRARARVGLDARRDVLVHALPLFHVHGLVVATLGTLRPRRRGPPPRGVRPGRASPRRSPPTRRCSSPSRRCTTASPTPRRPIRRSPQGLRGARLLVSGSAALRGRRARAHRGAAAVSGSSSATA